MGAWKWFYRLGFTSSGDARKADGIHAIKQELVYNGYSEGIVLTLPTFGKFAVAETKRFQKANALEVDGIVGPNTARVLFRKRTFEVEDELLVPDHLLARLLHLESNDDPVAEGTVDPADEGIAQIHLPAHPEVDEQESHDPAFSIPWAGRYLKGLYTATGSKDWDCALAAYNLGTTLAKQWLAAGKPTAGGPKLGNGDDAWARASSYVRLVRASSF